MSVVDHIDRPPTIATFWPSTKPDCAQALLESADMTCRLADDLLLRNPTTGIADCCARAASGHAAVAPPSSAMKSRRFSSGRDARFIARPAHRTVRAAFPHTAPTLGV